MNKILITLVSGMILLAFSTTARSHDVVDANGRPSTTHKHVWRQQAYGKDYRQGHSKFSSIRQAGSNLTEAQGR